MKPGTIPKYTSKLAIVNRGTRIELPVVRHLRCNSSINILLYKDEALSGAGLAVLVARSKEVIFAVVACWMTYDESRYLAIFFFFAFQVRSLWTS
jgi:hypothetical protein